MPSTTIDLADEGLEGGDNISPYIDRHWDDGTEVLIPAGTYRYDGSGLNGSRGDCSLVGSEDGVEFIRDAHKIRPTVRCTHGTMRVENITIRGRTPSSANTEGDRWRFEALRPDSVVEVVNVNHPDGSADNSDSNAFLTYDDHRGTLHFKNCYTKGFGNSTYYTNLGYRSGERNPVIIENCVIVDANGAIRGGHNGSQYVDCTFVWRNEPPTWVSGSAIARGIRWDHPGHDNLVRNCHFYFADGIGSVGESLDVADQGASTSGQVDGLYVYTESDGAGGVTDQSGGNWDYRNVHVSGPGDPRMDCDVDGSQEPDLSCEGIVWMPESQTVRPGSGGGLGNMFTIMATGEETELSYRFEADGPVTPATDTAFDGATSVGESNDTITANGDGTYTVEGVTGKLQGDAFRVHGEVTAFERLSGESGYDLYWNGDVFDPAGGRGGSPGDGTDGGNGGSGGDGSDGSDGGDGSDGDQADDEYVTEQRVMEIIGASTLSESDVRGIVEEEMVVDEETKNALASVRDAIDRVLGGSGG